MGFVAMGDDVEHNEEGNAQLGLQKGKEKFKGMECCLLAITWIIWKESNGRAFEGVGHLGFFC